MLKFIKRFTNKTSLKVQQSEFGAWVVQKNDEILYIGSKEKCESFLTKLKVA